MAFISKEKLHVSVYSGHLQVLTIFCFLTELNLTSLNAQRGWHTSEL